MHNGLLEYCAISSRSEVRTKFSRLFHILQGLSTTLPLQFDLVFKIIIASTIGGGMRLTPRRGPGFESPCWIVLGRSEFKTSATLVNSQLFVSCQLGL